MNKNVLFYLCAVCTAFLTHLTPSHASNMENSQSQITDINYSTITKITYIDDEFEPEMILTLDNDLRLISKCSAGIFFEGQSVEVSFDGDHLILTTYSLDDSDKGKITFQRMGENSHFYQAI